MKITATKISVPLLNSMIKRMLLMDSSLYLCIDKEHTSSSVFNDTQDIIKSYQLNTDDIFAFSEDLGDKKIRLSFYAAQKLLNTISHFDPHKLSAEISLFIEDNIHYADKITLKDSKLKITVYCQDPSLGFTTLTDEQLGRALDKSSKEFGFTLPKEDFAKISSMITMDESELFKIYGDQEGVHIKTEVFDIVVDDNVKFEQPTSVKSTFKTFLNRIDKETFDVTVCENKLVLKSQETATDMALNLAITD